MIKEYEDSKKASNKDAEKNNLAIKNEYAILKTQI